MVARDLLVEIFVMGSKEIWRYFTFWSKTFSSDVKEIFVMVDKEI